jgi:tryptophan-rich sensory protein
MLQQLKIILISFSHFLLSIPYIIFNNTNLNNRPKVFLQPPKLVFSFVWTILYIFFGISNLKILYNHNLSNNKKINIINQSITESLLHWLWLLINSNFINNYYYLKFISTFILTYIVYYSFIRAYYLKKTDKFLHKLYIPYKLWIIFALYLELAYQI